MSNLFSKAKSKIPRKYDQEYSITTNSNYSRTTHWICAIILAFTDYFERMRLVSAQYLQLYNEIFLNWLVHFFTQSYVLKDLWDFKWKITLKVNILYYIFTGSGSCEFPSISIPYRSRRSTYCSRRFTENDFQCHQNPKGLSNIFPDHV